MSITIKNNSDRPVLFSVFNAGDNGIPYYAKWIDAHDSAKMETGNFKALSTGAQMQEGGRWVGSDPADKPWASPGDTVTFTMDKVVS